VVATFSIVLALGVFGDVAPATAADGGTVSLANWDTSFCLDVSGWFGALRSPTFTAAEDPRITTIRYVGDIVTRSRQELSLERSGAPPVRGGRGIRRTIDVGFSAARAQFELALRTAKTLPAGTDPAFSTRLPTINRRLQQGVGRMIETLKRVYGHSGNPAFDRAIVATSQCDYIAKLALPSGSTT
jgi:hypothetical protein